jgi:hypothetical protein
MASAKPYKRDPARYKKVINAWNSYGYKGTLAEFADKMKVPRQTVAEWLRVAPECGMEARESVNPISKQQSRSKTKAEPEFTVPALPEDDISAEEIVAAKKKHFEVLRKHNDAVKLIKVKVNIDGPVGILHFGDPHLDDDGCDIAAIERHSDLTRSTEGLFGANVGDTTNNWMDGWPVCMPIRTPAAVARSNWLSGSSSARTCST